MFKAFPFNRKLNPKPKPNSEKVIHAFQPSFAVADAPPEHQFSMQGLDVVISHSLKVVWILDTSGAEDDRIVLELEEHLKSLGYFLFHTRTVQDKSLPAKT